MKNIQEDKKSRKVETVKAYASTGSLKMYYEIHGVGKLLILLHGGVGGIEMFGPNLSSLPKMYQVIAVELQAHGRTADIDRQLRFELMADDIAALMKHLGIGKAAIMGYSLGGGKHDAGLDGSSRPNARLAILPGVTHYNILSSATVAEVVTPFLDASGLFDK